MAPSEYGPWNPGIESQVPEHLRHLCTIFRPENVFTSLDHARELCDLTGLELADVTAFRPQRLALHELLVRVTADFSVPDGPRIEDLGINFRKIVSFIFSDYVEPEMEGIIAASETIRREISQVIDIELRMLFGAPQDPMDEEAAVGWLARVLARFKQRNTAHADGESAAERERRCIADWEKKAESSDNRQRALYGALVRVVTALAVRHGRIWGNREMIGSLASDIAWNQHGSHAIGRMIEPLVNAASIEQNYRMLPRQEEPVVMNTKGPSAAGKSTLRPLQKTLAGDIGVDWSDFALISPDIWRKQLIEYSALGAHYKYGGAFTGDEIKIVDQKLDHYVARKAERGDMPHLLIDRFRFDSFAPDSDEAGSNLLTRFGHIVYLFFLITPPASLVERAWFRGLEVGRYKAVDDTLAHSVEAYSGMPELFFTWAQRSDKRVHFEFLDNSVPMGERPRTVAFGWNDVMHVLDVKCLIDVERFRRVNIDAGDPGSLYDGSALLSPEDNIRFLRQCIERFRDINFAAQETGRIYLRIASGKPVWFDGEVLDDARFDADARSGLYAAAPLGFDAMPGPKKPMYLSDVEGFDQSHTLGRWGEAPV